MGTTITFAKESPTHTDGLKLRAQTKPVDPEQKTG
jgi:hypothetical protein